MLNTSLIIVDRKTGNTQDGKRQSDKCKVNKPAALCSPRLVRSEAAKGHWWVDRTGKDDVGMHVTV